MKFIKLLIALMIVVVLLNACQKQDSEISAKKEQVEQEKVYHIALVMKTLTNPFFITMERGAREAEKDLGIKLTVKTGSQETAITQQIDIIRRLIEDKVDAIVIAPASSIELVPVLAKAQQAGIVIVNIDNELDKATSLKYELKNVPFISVNNEEGAYLSAKFISKDVTKKSKAIILEGIRTAQNGIDRKNGAIKAFNENKNIELVASETANWKIDEGYEVFSQIWKKHKDLKLVFSANDMMALGVIQFLQDNNIKDVKVAAFDNIEEVKPHLQSGALSVTIDQQADVQGYKGIETAYKLLRNEPIESVVVSVIVVTKQ